MNAEFDIGRWAAWVCQQTSELRGEGERAPLTFNDASKASDNPAFVVDFDNASVVGQIVFWSTGDYDLTVQRLDAENPVCVSGWPMPVTDENFGEVFGRFVALVRKVG